MGAANFEVTGQGETPEAAFRALVTEAQYEHGHGGYTGTIAEKDGFVMVQPIATLPGVELAYALYDHDESKVPAAQLADFRAWAKVADDKWGPALAVPTGEREWMFFGFASE
jgi:hypothetical protein